MKTNNENQQPQNVKPFEGASSNLQVYLNEEKGTLTHVLNDNVRIVMPINLYKQILGLPFTKRELAQPQVPTTKSQTYGLVARPSIYLSKDGKYLFHRVLGIRISKHVNYYKKILETNVSSEVKSA